MNNHYWNDSSHCCLCINVKYTVICNNIIYTIQYNCFITVSLFHFYLCVQNVEI